MKRTTLVHLGFSPLIENIQCSEEVRVTGFELVPSSLRQVGQVNPHFDFVHVPSNTGLLVGAIYTCDWTIARNFVAEKVMTTNLVTR